MTESEAWRQLLYYPLGLLPLAFFSARFFIQWWQSERQQRSHVTALFWKLSLAGNALFLLHYCVQVQFPLALIQGGNAVIAWRNLNLMQSPCPLSTRQTLGLFSTVLMGTTLLFTYLQQGQWIHPQWSQAYGWSWHLLGFLASALFASRFWVQWWECERTQKSRLSALFWWLSLAGSSLMIAYSALLHDWVTLLPHSVGLLPYLRNLMLMRKQAVSA